MQIDVYSKDYSEKYLEIHVNNLEIDFIMTLNENDCTDIWSDPIHSCLD